MKCLTSKPVKLQRHSENKDIIVKSSFFGGGRDSTTGTGYDVSIRLVIRTH